MDQGEDYGEPVRRWRNYGSPKTKEEGKEKVFIILGVALVLFFSLGLLENRSDLVIRVVGDSMDWRSRWLMGHHGVDCGRVRIGGDPKAATECALKAQKEGKPFRVRYDIQGYDSAVAGGIVRTPSGDLYGA